MSSHATGAGGLDSKKLIRQFLDTERAFGIDSIPKAMLSVPVVSQARDGALVKLEAEFKQCQMCPLSATRTQVVFGSGNPEAALLFVGEAPGFDEDKQGLAFVGAAGQLLSKIIEAMKLKPEDVYRAYCLKCLPPENRSPLPSELAVCGPILFRQIEIIKPRIICTLGKFAAQTLLSTEEPVSRLRGRFHDFHGIKLMATFDPAYLLKNPADKKLVWEDMQKIMKELQIE